MTNSIGGYGNKLLDGNGLLHLVGTIKAEIANGNNSGITEDDIKEGITIEADHDEGEGYNELSISTDDVSINSYDENGNPSGGYGFGWNEVVEYSEDNGDTIKTTLYGEITTDNIRFSREIINDTQGQDVEQKDIVIIPNLDDSVIEVDFNDSITGTSETKTLATLDDIPDLPTPSLADEGKAIAVNSTGTGWSLKQYATFPSLTNNASKILAVNSGGTGVEWITAPSSGTTYTAGTGISIVNGVISINLSNAEEGTF